jgi:hypothetical protein
MCERVSSAWTAGCLGAQTFSGAPAFNTNIGAWNTARVNTLSNVFAAFPARAARQCKRDALGRVFDAARAVVRGACDRVRALTMRGMCASATRSLRNAIHRCNTHRYGTRYMMHACIYIHGRLATRTNGSPMRARRTHARAHVLRPCARACARAIGRPRIRADTCERVPSAWTAGGSVLRRLKMRRRSTRTSHRGMYYV